MFKLIFRFFSIIDIYTGFGRLYEWSGILPNYIRKQWIHVRYEVVQEQWEACHLLLLNKFPYYKLLSSKEKIEFLVRLFDFKNQLEFEGRHGLELTNDKTFLICASLSQYSFGFSDFRLSRFQKIIIYPEDFYSQLIDHQVKGLTLSTGFISISWRDFEEGYIEFDGGINLGLHEFAHAYMLSKSELYILAEEYPLNYSMQYIQEDIKNQELHLFRDYGFSNVQEFWAVLCELFFEKPIVLQETYPNLYRLTSRALNQDMALMLNRYIKNKNI